MPSLKSLNLSIAYYSAFAADTLVYAVTLTLNACDVMKLGTKFERNWAISGGVIAILVFELLILKIALRVVLGSGIIFTKFDLQQLIPA